MLPRPSLNQAAEGAEVGDLGDVDCMGNYIQVNRAHIQSGADYRHLTGRDHAQKQGDHVARRAQTATLADQAVVVGLKGRGVLRPDQVQADRYPQLQSQEAQPESRRGLEPPNTQRRL